MTFLLLVLLGSGNRAYAEGKVKIAQLQDHSIEELNRNFENGYEIMGVYLAKNPYGDIVLEEGILLEELASWMRAHPQVQILFRTKGLEIDTLVEAHKNYPQIKNQGIAEIKDQKDYSKVSFNGFKTILLNSKLKDYSSTEIGQMAYSYPYFGILVDKDKLSPALVENIKAGRSLVYVEENEAGNFSSYIVDKMVDGYIVDPEGEKPVIGAPGIENPYIIAHAGGQIGSYTYTNSIDAMENSYKNGIRLMEIDFEWSTDNRLVGLHSWDGFLTRLFNQPIRRYSYHEYENFSMVNGWQHANLDKLDKWFKDHPDAYLVTDIKDNNIEGLKVLKDKYPQLAQRTIPQIYQIGEYEKAKSLGYEDIILTLYLVRSTDEEIVAFAQKNKLFAITMPEAKAKTDLPQRLKDQGVYVYAHTINNLQKADRLEALGVAGFYSDLHWNDNVIILP